MSTGIAEIATGPALPAICESVISDIRNTHLAMDSIPAYAANQRNPNMATTPRESFSTRTLLTWASGLHLYGTRKTFMFDEFRADGEPVPYLAIGRDKACPIQLQDRALSRVHAVLERDDDYMLVNDSGSENGITIDGEPLARQVRIAVGMHVRLSSNTLLIGVGANTLVPIVACSINELCYIGYQVYGSFSEAARRFALEAGARKVGREFLRSHGADWQRQRLHG